MRSTHLHSPFVPTDIRGESSGTSEELAKFILTDLKPPGPKRRPLLYLTGDKNRDTLPEILRGGNWDLVPLQVYQTQGSSTFSQNLKLALDSPHHQNSNDWWIVFFAPSAASFAAPFLRDHFDLPSTDSTSVTRRPAQVASIGSTTSTFLRQQLHLSVAAVARKPTPDDLLQAMIAS
ncbi:tetrapyrrole biosynthesis, uroporphyrinogen III synthase [Mycena pura]|uniref:Tetrapyrrole biosynthesis, uroporphyrinogen III synthase n=1 Tax=Mycena pura TaxID=153505 RepID=A0AAD7E4G3_9AGAR|nr:tetrapyrrole biosynthesis, uroporphyrinogen III synthase [Mycena pura]